jgi:hypothetical protein
MTLATTEKRLENIECNLTPKEWAIRLADEIRSYPTGDDFYDAMSEYPDSNETPIVKPFFMLDRLVEKQHPGNNPQAISERNRLCRKLRGEYHALKLLISDTNDKMKRQAEIFDLKATIHFWMLDTLRLKILMGKPKERNADDTESYEGVFNLSFLSRVKFWVNGMTQLIYDFLIYDAVCKMIQEKYFDGHPFIYRNVEALLARTYKMMEEMAAWFNDVVKAIEAAYTTEAGEDESGIAAPDEQEENEFIIDMEEIKESINRQPLSIVVVNWVKNAKDKATESMLGETDHNKVNAFLWDRVKEQARMRKTLDKTITSILTKGKGYEKY